MSEDTLLDMQLTLTEKVGLVHQMPYATTRNGVASHAEKVLTNTLKVIDILSDYM